MKKMSVILLLAILVTASSCKDTPQTIAYKTISSLVVSVDEGMKAYADAVVAGKVDVPTQAKVRDLKSKYEKALVIAVNDAQGATSVPPPVALVDAATDLFSIINIFRK